MAKVLSGYLPICSYCKRIREAGGLPAVVYGHKQGPVSITLDAKESLRFFHDGDRVFLTGHSMGGDAAWDIALAHPDLWAGAIPLVATTGKSISTPSERPIQFRCMVFTESGHPSRLSSSSSSSSA